MLYNTIIMINDDIYTELPILYKSDSKNKIRIWKLRMYFYGDRDKPIKITNLSSKNKKIVKGRLLMCSGLKFGKLSTTELIINSGKRIGMKNETDVKLQTISVGISRHNRKIKKDSYFTSENKAINSKSYKNITIIKPQLLHTYDKHNSKIDINNACVQPKIDGIRMLSRKVDDKIIFFGRKGEIFQIHGLGDEINQIPEINIDGFVIDGELYDPNENFEVIQGISSKKKLSPEEQEILDSMSYYVFDIFDINRLDSLTFDDRRQYMDTLFENINFIKVIQVPVYDISNEDDVEFYHKKFVKQGYEGLVIRNLAGLYKINGRSYDVQKKKYFTDSDFMVVGFKSGKGTKLNTIIWRCETKTHRKFWVSPTGTTVKESKKVYAMAVKNFDKFYGRFLQVKHQGYTKYGIPRFAKSKLYPRVD